GFIGAILVNFIFALSSAFSHARAQKEVSANARIAIESMISDLRYAHSVYTPTSVFGTSPGQLSVATLHNAPPDHNRTYFEYYVSSSRLYVKREGQEPSVITSERVKISGLTFNYFKNGTGTAESVKINLTVSYDAPPARSALQAASSLSATVALRGAY
ncbi:MAG: hypothetical protein ACYS1A_20260, partial [Planctomycetota bacterium]